MYRTESLQELRQKIDLVEVLSPYVSLQRAGSAVKACCPFHEEKTPSFMVQRGDTHYHCYGCGAHGDAIAFLMGHLKMSFVDAIEHLAERFHVQLERADQSETKRNNKAQLKEALETACQLFHFLLQKSEEAEGALRYLYQRGIDLAFIRHFRLGYAPQDSSLLMRYLREKGYPIEILEEAGLVATTQSGGKRDFFSQRITFPICDATGSIIGFSGRKFQESTFGGKYINSPETPLFKKSHVLFGLSYCRSRMAKEGRAIIVEGQIDALRLIYNGFDYTVAGQGTAFGKDHVQELLRLGVKEVFLALDGDRAGREAAVKIGQLFQQKKVSVVVLSLPEGSDPDTILVKEGPDAFSKLLANATDYLTFLYRYHASDKDLTIPAQKSNLVAAIVKQVRTWEDPVLIFESLRKVAKLAEVPEDALMEPGSAVKIQRSGRAGLQRIDASRILETDLLRWLILMGESNPKVVAIASHNIKEEDLKVPLCRRLFQLYFEAHRKGEPRDLFQLGIQFDQKEEHAYLEELLQKRVNLQKAEEGMKETVKQILLRNWMERCEELKSKIQNPDLTDEESILLAKEFNEQKKRPPEVLVP